VRRRILGGRLTGKPRPVHYNTWEAIYFDHDLPTLKGLADLAASVGVERFVLDDGWFLGRPDDRSGLGDWSVDPVKYPDGLTPLIDHVRSLGMEFGLWVEPEMANADSDLLRAHPDWILGVPGRRQPLGRGQYVLDLTRPEVWSAIHAQIDALLRGNAIGYLKWDMNRDLTHAQSGGRAATHRQTLAVYALIDRLRADHPRVEIESCSSGGARADYEILKRTDRVWTSDCNDPIERQSIQRGFSIFIPPEVMGSHVGPRASHTTARTASLQMRAMTALFGHMGTEADLRDFTDAERAALAEAFALYKDHRAWMHAGRTVRLSHPDPGCLATALAGEGRMLVSAAQVETPKTAGLAPLRLAGLDPAATYRIQQIKPPRRARATMRRVPPLTLGETLSATGAMLAHTGISLPVLRAGEIAVFLLAREDA
jgi:alpha-galactosidase